MEGIISSVSSSTVVMGLLDAFAVISVVIGLYLLFTKNPILVTALKTLAVLKGVSAG
ncbi:MAG: hypothetical protein NTU49_10120 [Gammaproteobacteria bacterium]|nr:hypothetical protein [Gammaproteobacteria bacterium]